MEANLRKLGLLYFSLSLYLAGTLLYGIPSSVKLLEEGMAAFEVGLYDIAAKNFSEISYNYPSDPVVVTASFLEALSLYYAEDSAAVDRFKGHLQQYLNSPYRDQLWYWIGMGELLIGNKEAGLNALDQYLEEATVDSKYYLFANDAKARVLEELHRYEEALFVYKKLLITKTFEIDNLSKNTIVNWLDRSGALSLKIGLFQDAEKFYRTILVNHSSSDKVKDALFWIGESAYWGGKILEAAERFQRYIETFPNGFYQETAMFRLSGIYLATEDFDKANHYLNILKTKLDSLKDTNKILGVNSERVAVLALQADIYSKENRWIDAVNLYRTGLEMVNDKKTQQLLQNKAGVALKKTGKITEAINIFRKAETGPDINLREIAMYNRAILLVENGKLESAVQALISFSDQFPDSVRKAEVEKLLLDLMTETNDFTGQIDLLNSLSKTRQLSFYEKKLQGIALISLKDYSEAIKVFSRPISSDDSSQLAEQSYFLGAAYAYQEEFIRAVPLFLSAIEYSDSNEEIHLRANYALATAYLNVGQYQESLFFLEKVFGLSEGLTYSWTESALFARGSVFYRLGRLREATNDFESLAKSRKNFFIGEKNGSFVPSYQVAMKWQALSLFRSGDIKSTIPIFLKLANSELKDKGYYWYRAGLSALLLNDLLASENYFLEALKYSDDRLLEPLVMYELFNVYLNIDDLNAANTILRTLREQYPNDYLTSLAGINNAERLKKVGFLSESSAEFQLIYQLHEQNGLDHSEFGEIALYEAIKIESKSSDVQEFLDLVWKFFEIYPDSVRLEEIGRLFVDGLNKVSDTIVQGYFQHIVARQKINQVPYELEKIIYLSYAERKLKKNPEVVADILNELLVKTTNGVQDFDILSMIGKSYEEAGMFDAALSLYQGMTLSEFDVQAGYGALGISRVLLQSGDNAEAAKQYGITAIRFQNIPHIAAEAWYRGSNTYLLSENLKEAQIFKEQLLSLFPDSEWAKKLMEL